MQESGISSNEVQRLMQGLAAPSSLPLRPQDAALLHGSSAFRFGVDNSRCAWSIGDGPDVLMVHGWGGRGVQMAPLARFLAAHGFRCTFFDAAGHGDSKLEPIGFDTFIRDTAALQQHLNKPVFAWVGHSAGGLGMMAARALKGVHVFALPIRRTCRWIRCGRNRQPASR